MSVVEAGIAVLNSMPEGTFIVSLGGGSSMDAAKAMSVIGPDGGATGEDIAQYCMVPELAEDSETINMATMLPKKFATKPSATIIAIPTTSGTASETNGAAVISDDRFEFHRKLIFQYPGAMAAQTILDPELTLGLPAYPTATCGMDALTHSIEALTSARQNPYSDAVAIGSIQLVAKWLPILMADLSNLDARLHIMTASHMAGIAFGISGLGICHAVGHPLSALLNKAHGQTLSTMLPHVRTPRRATPCYSAPCSASSQSEGGSLVCLGLQRSLGTHPCHTMHVTHAQVMEFNLPVRADKYTMVADAFGVKDASADDETNARAAIKAVAELSISVGTAMSIEQMGGTPEIIAEAVQQAITDLCILSNARPATSADVLGANEHNATQHNAHLHAHPHAQLVAPVLVYGTVSKAAQTHLMVALASFRISFSYEIARW